MENSPQSTVRDEMRNHNPEHKGEKNYKSPKGQDAKKVNYMKFDAMAHQLLSVQLDFKGQI